MWQTKTKAESKEISLLCIHIHCSIGREKTSRNHRTIAAARKISNSRVLLSHNFHLWETSHQCGEGISSWIMDSLDYFHRINFHQPEITFPFSSRRRRLGQAGVQIRSVIARHKAKLENLKNNRRERLERRSYWIGSELLFKAKKKHAEAGNKKLKREIVHNWTRT